MYDLYTALFDLHIYNFFVSSVFSYDFLLVFITKAFKLVLLFLKSYSHLSSSCQKQGVGHKAWFLARWVRPAIKHAQDVLFWWVRPGVMV